VKESTAADGAIRVGVIADQTGPLSFMGIANANVARMVIGDVNAKGGLLGRKIELFLEDGATTDSVAEAKATKLVQRDRVDVILGGIYFIAPPGWRSGRLPSRRARPFTSLPGAIRGTGM
jgi:ABC-type branched-subunit amino acid transport system substrate-binding protein